MTERLTRVQVTLDIAVAQMTRVERKLETL